MQEATATSCICSLCGNTWLLSKHCEWITRGECADVLLSHVYRYFFAPPNEQLLDTPSLEVVLRPRKATESCPLDMERFGGAEKCLYSEKEL